ncbi:MAG: thrombospondin type 3 repeat-containing protein [Flavobacteriales bacterium]|nr:thrombospondin type 3 repeat-containing protein [Flavobacteriales bacterium]
MHPERRPGQDVPDKEDSCPTKPALATLGGCPDGDGDGVADKMDACPTLGAVTQQGCPDSDGDGIADNVDSARKWLV